MNTPFSDGNQNPKPLLNIGEVMQDSIPKTDNIPDLSGKTKVIGQTADDTLVAPTKVTQAHRIVFVLARSGASLHREEIARRAEIPISSTGSITAKLTHERVLVSPDWGYYALSKDFLRQFQYAYGTPKTETLLKMMDEGGVDVAQFEFPLNEIIPAKPSMLDAIKAYVESQRNRMSEIEQEIQKLTEEKTAIETDMARIGQMAALHVVKEAA